MIADLSMFEQGEPPTPPQHYPGPWRVVECEEGRVWVEETNTEERLVVCDIPGDMETIEGPELRNAQLIAAAPELLEACKALLAAPSGLDHFCHVPESEGGVKCPACAAAAAIKKAVGDV